MADRYRSRSDAELPGGLAGTRMRSSLFAAGTGRRCSCGCDASSATAFSLRTYSPRRSRPPGLPLGVSVTWARARRRGCTGSHATWCGVYVTTGRSRHALGNLDRCVRPRDERGHDLPRRANLPLSRTCECAVSTQMQGEAPRWTILAKRPEMLSAQATERGHKTDASETTCATPRDTTSLGRKW